MIGQTGSEQASRTLLGAPQERYLYLTRMPEEAIEIGLVGVERRVGVRFGELDHNGIGTRNGRTRRNALAPFSEAWQAGPVEAMPRDVECPRIGRYVGDRIRITGQPWHLAKPRL